MPNHGICSVKLALTGTPQSPAGHGAVSVPLMPLHWKSASTPSKAGTVLPVVAGLHAADDARQAVVDARKWTAGDAEVRRGDRDAAADIAAEIEAGPARGRSVGMTIGGTAPRQVGRKAQAGAEQQQ